MSWIAVTAVLLCPAMAGAQQPGWGGYDSPFGHVRAYSGVTGAYAPGALNSFGLGGVFEPKATLWDFLVLGGRVDGAALVGLDASNVQTASLAMRIVLGAMVKGEILLAPGEVRPFVGLAVGYYAAVLLGGSIGNTSSFTGTGPGVMPQIGVDLGWFRAAVQYHLIFGSLGAADYLAIELAWRVY